MRDIFEYKNSFEKYRHVKSVLLYGDVEKCPTPKITVIMPVFGNPPFFIHSFYSVINQNVNFDYEVVIVDNTPLDHSKSETQKLVEKTTLPYVFYYRNEENIGMTGNWNRGIELARADLITFCHDDDMLYPNCLSTLWKLHADYPDKWIIPGVRIIDESVSYPFENAEPQNPPKNKCIPFGKIDIFMVNPTNGVGCLFHKKHMLALGGYNEEYYPSQDNALHIQYVFKYGAVRCQLQLYCYRITSKNESNNVYKKFITNGLFYCKCMAPYMNLPHFIINRLEHAYKTNITITMESVWANKTEYSVKYTMSDKIVNNCVRLYHKLKALSL